MNYIETATLILRDAEAESVRKKLRDEVAQHIDEKNKSKEDIEIELGWVQSPQDQIMLLEEGLESQKEEARRQAIASTIEAYLTSANFALCRDDIVQ